MRCGGQRACNPSSAQKQFEHRFGASAALADRPGISAPVGYRTRFGRPAMQDVSFAFDGRTARKIAIQASDFRASQLD